MDPELRKLNAGAFDALRAAWRSGNLTVVVGAGASCQSGLPTWSGVLDEMLFSYVERTYQDTTVEPIAGDIRKALRDRMQHESPIVVAHHLRSSMTDREYIEFVHNTLYGHLQGGPEPGPIARAVGRLGTKLRSVITFNYDDLVEKALSIEGTQNTSVWKPHHWSQVQGVPVYHPHGFLPYHKDPQEIYEIVLAEAEYHTQYSSPGSWSNLAVSRALLQDTCLFVSTSITDPNLRRMLDLLHRDTPDRFHYFLWSTPLKGTFKHGLEEIAHKAFEKVFTESHKRIGLMPVWFHYRGDDPNGIDRNHNWKDLPEILDAIREL